MPLFENAMTAWHDAMMTREGVQDPFAPKIAGTAPGASGEVYDAALAQIAKAIKALPKEQRIAGNWCYGPDSLKNAVGQARDLMYAHYRENNGTKFVSSYASTIKVTILVGAAAQDVRHRASNNGEAHLSHAEVASRLAMARSSFSQTWRQDYEGMINHLHQLALQALTELEPLVNEMNRNYQKAG